MKVLQTYETELKINGIVKFYKIKNLNAIKVIKTIKKSLDIIEVKTNHQIIKQYFSIIK